MSEEIRVRRAKRADVPAITALVQRASESRAQVSEAEVMEWLFSKGLWVATQGDASTEMEETVVGIAAWQTENLVSVTDVFYVSPARLRSRAGGQLLETLEAEANVLMCEANVVLLAAGTSKSTRTFLQQQGYEPKELPALHRIWREVLDEFVTEEMELMVKRLRERMVMVPI